MMLKLQWVLTMVIKYIIQIKVRKKYSSLSDRLMVLFILSIKTNNILYNLFSASIWSAWHLLIMPKKRQRQNAEEINREKLESCSNWKVAKSSTSRVIWSQLTQEYFGLNYIPKISKVRRFQYFCKDTVAGSYSFTICVTIFVQIK